jgi:hypothetical protein
VKLLSEGVTESDGLALIPISSKNITEFYPGVEIPARTYPWQANAVSTVAVKAVLISFDFRHGDCDNVGKFAQLVSANRGWLLRNGHPKWKVVDLDAQLKGWEQYDCVKKYLSKRPVASAEKASPMNPVLDAIKQMLGN